MEGTGLAVGAEAPVIGHAVGGVRVLLHLGDEDPRPDGVERPCRDEKHISRMDRHLIADFRQGILLDVPAELPFGQPAVDPIDQPGSRLAIDDVPHLGLAVFPFHPGGIGVVRMHLDRQPVFGIDQLDEQGEIGEAGSPAAEGARPPFREGFRQGAAGQRAVSHYRRPVFMTGEDPCFCRGRALGGNPEIRQQARASPQVFF